MTRAKTNFREFFTDVAFLDRFEREADRAVDVIVPLLHTNELWRANLLSIYREIPVNRLLLGDGGCIDNSIEIARNFPRVEVLDHRSFRSLGFSIRRLIEEVSTEWFVYLHSDVYLPAGWFDAMCAGRQKYDWFECGQNVTVMVEYIPPTLEVERAYSGSQMGRKTAFADIISDIGDDYLYRNEDIILANLIKRAGFRYGKVKDTFHHHQLMFKESPWLRRVKRATFDLELSREEEIRAALTYVMGIIKYLKPDESTDLVPGINQNIERLTQLGALDRTMFACWVAEKNPVWSAIYRMPSGVDPTEVSELSGRFEAGSDFSSQPNAGGPPVVRKERVPSRVSGRFEAGSDFSSQPNAGDPPAVSEEGVPPRASRIATYLLSAVDLSLRRIVGPGRHIRARLQPHGVKTRAAMRIRQLGRQVGLRAHQILRKTGICVIPDSKFRQLNQDREELARARQELARMLPLARMLQERDVEVAQFREIARRKDEELVAQYKRSALLASGTCALALQYSRVVADRLRRLRESANDAMRDQRPLVAIIVTSTSQVPHVKALCLSAVLAKDHRFFVFAYVDPVSSGLYDFCARNGVALMRMDFELIVGSDEFASYVVGEDGLYEWSAGSPLGWNSAEAERIAPIYNLMVELRNQTTIAKSCRRVLQIFGVRLVVVFEDNAEHSTGIWIGVSREALISNIIIPFTIADQLEPAEAHYNDPLYWADQGLFNRYASWLLPHWSYRHKDRDLVRRPGAAILAIETLGFAPPSPWLLNSSRADAIAVESARMREHYCKLGFPARQLVVTGSLMDDVMYYKAAQRDSMRKELGLDVRKCLVLCSFPPNQLTATRPDCEFSDFGSLIDFWLGQLVNLKDQIDCEVIVKPHPALEAQHVERLRSFPLVFTERETATLIPICDLYNTSVSSTIRWALACGKPVLNYDVFRYRYLDFRNEPAVITVEQRDEFTGRLAEICGVDGELASLTDKARVTSGEWGMLDGASDARLCALFRRLMCAQP